MAFATSGGGGSSAPPKPPPPSTRTGNNPRGVAIAPPPKPTVNDRAVIKQTVARATQGTPRGTSIPAAPLPQTVNDVQATHPDPKAVVQVFRSQPLAQQKAVVKGALTHPTVPASQIILNFVKNSGNFQNLVMPPHGPDLLTGAAHLASRGLGAVASGIDKVQQLGQEISPTVGPGGGARVGVGGLSLPPGVGRVVTHAPIDVARAALQDPAVIPETLKGLADSTVGMVAGTAELPIKAVQEGPGKAISQLASAAAQDYMRRYGPLAAGNDQAFINRIKKEGAGPELFDALGLAGGVDATGGRALSSLARAREAITGEPNLLTRERPNLLLSGNKERPQTIAPTAGRAAAQRLEDYIRAKRPGGELTPKKGQVAPLFQSHAIRVVHSGIAQRWRRVVQENLKREVRGYHGSALHAIGKLGPEQKYAIYHAVQGIRMDTPEHLRADLADRRAEILKDRANPASLGNRIPAQYADKVDELKLIDRLTANADRIAGPKMVKFQAGEAARNQRIVQMTSLHPATAEARALRPIGDRLGIEHPDAMAQRMFGDTGHKDIAEFAGGRRGAVEGMTAQQGRALKDYELNRPQYLAKYVDKVRAAMKEKGIPEPGYFRHQERPEIKYGDYASGSGARAMPADQRSSFALHRAGVADTSPQAYMQGLARTIKRPLQWRLTDEQFRAAALPTPTAEEIKAALGKESVGKPNASQTPEELRRPLGKQVHPSELTGNELRRVLEHRGVDMKKVMFVNPGRLAEQTLSDHGLLPKGKTIAETHDLENADLHHALQQGDIVQSPKMFDSQAFMTTPGWKAIPKTAFDEIHGNLKGSSLLGRSVGKFQGGTAGLILNQNPHFVIMNTLAHAVPAVAGTKGRFLADAARFPVWWHGLSDQERDVFRAYGGGRGGHMATTARLGSQAPNQIAAFGQKLETHGLAQVAKSVNPFHGLLAAEDLQSNFFRNAIMYHEAKRAAFQDMAHEYGRAVAQWERVKNVFGKADPQDRMRAIMNDLPRMEELGRTAVNILGDYGRFTNRERQFFNNRAVLFYSFLRHVTRTLLYVLPARHPLALAMLQELGNLHVQEVKKLMGGQDLPWTYGRLFFQKGGKLSSVDLTSTSPLSSPLVNVVSGGVKELPQLLSPALGSVLDVAYGQTPLGQPVQRNAWSFLNDLASLSYPYRQGAAAHFGLKTQQSDSIPFIHERPKVDKTKAAEQYLLAKEKARGPLEPYLLGSALGLYPKPDDSRVIAQHQVKLAQAHARNLAKKKGGGGGYLLGAPAPSKASGGGGYLLGGASPSSSGSSSGYLLP